MFCIVTNNSQIFQNLYFKVPHIYGKFAALCFILARKKINNVLSIIAIFFFFQLLIQVMHKKRIRSTVNRYNFRLDLV